MKNLKFRLALMNFIEFAVWGAYLTCMGLYLNRIGMASEIGYFYARYCEYLYACYYGHCGR